jgi:formylglycine-generating enzyme required for sulfatase activity
MAKAESRSITRRALVAGSAAVAAGVPKVAVARMSEAICGEADPGCRFAHPGYETDADPVYAAIAAHARAYAAYDAQQKAAPGDEETLEPLIEAEWAAAAALAATVPTTLAGAAAALDHVRTLREREDYMLFDDWHCYVFIGSAATAMRNVLDRSPA